MNRILVVGCRGMLGTDLMELLSGTGSFSAGKGACPSFPRPSCEGLNRSFGLYTPLDFLAEDRTVIRWILSHPRLWERLELRQPPIVETLMSML